jgi:hypothetical protein
MPRTNETSIDPDGAFVRVCQNCENEFLTDNERAKYCSLKCKRAADNKRWYAAHASEVSSKNAARQKAKRKAK